MNSINIKFSPFLKDIALTTLTSVITIISMILLTRILAKEFGPDGFGTYSLARRLISLAIPVFTVSIGVSLTRFIAITDKNFKRINYLLSAILLVFIVSLVLSAACYYFADFLTLVIFHSPQHLNLFYSCLFMVTGFGIYTILYSYYRGIQSMNSANLWQLFIMAVLPLIISYAFAKHRNPALIIGLMGMSAYISIIPLLAIIIKHHKKDIRKIGEFTKDLFSYGLLRTPGGLIFIGILTIGPILAPYFGTLSDAGYLVIGQSVFRVIEASVVAFGLVALPKFSQFVAEGNTDFLRNRISDILTMIIHLSLFIVIQLFIWANEIVLIWLGADYLQAVPIIQIFLITLCPYLSYVMLRSIIDAVEKKAVNTLNLLISFGITILLCFVFGNLGFGAIGLAIAAAIGMSCLGIFSSYFLVKKYKIRLTNLKFASILLINCLIAIIDIIAKKYSIAYFDSIQLFVAMTLIGGLLFVSYAWFLYKRKTDWVIQLKIRIFPQTSS